MPAASISRYAEKMSRNAPKILNKVLHRQIPDDRRTDDSDQEQPRGPATRKPDGGEIQGLSACRRQNGRNAEQKRNRAARSRCTPNSMATVRTAPDRDTPGIKAAA